MKEAEKEAERIMVKYGTIIGKHDRVNIELPNVLNGYRTAKQCALIHIQGIIDEYENKICYAGYDYDWDMWNYRKIFWEEVKEIIKNK